MGSFKEEEGTLTVIIEGETIEVEDNHSGEARNDKIETENNLVLSAVIRLDPVTSNNTRQKTKFVTNVLKEDTTQDSVIPQTLMQSVKIQIPR